MVEQKVSNMDPSLLNSPFSEAGYSLVTGPQLYEMNRSSIITSENQSLVRKLKMSNMIKDLKDPNNNNIDVNMLVCSTPTIKPSAIRVHPALSISDGELNELHSEPFLSSSLPNICPVSQNSQSDGSKNTLRYFDGLFETMITKLVGLLIFVSQSIMGAFQKTITNVIMTLLFIFFFFVISYGTLYHFDLIYSEYNTIYFSNKGLDLGNWLNRMFEIKNCNPTLPY
jgi:hypothetical protein